MLRDADSLQKLNVGCSAWIRVNWATRLDYSPGKVPNPEIQKILCKKEYVEDFLLITTKVLFAAQIHSKEMKLTP